MDEALALARSAVANGIRQAVLTPHVHPGVFDNKLSTLRPRYEAFRAALESHAIELEVHLGSEVRLMVESLELLESGELPMYGAWEGQPVMLVELPHEQIPVGTLNAMVSLRRRGIYPMLAHPERNKAVMRDWTKLKPLMQEGLCLSQLTAGSICGGFGAAARQTAWRLLDNGWGTVVATDAHNLRHRPPLLRQAGEALERRYGRPAAQRLMQENPARIIEGNG